jgi:hypothetical protein
MSVLRILKAGADTASLRVAVSDMYPLCDEMTVRNLSLLWAVVAAAYGDLAYHLRLPPSDVVRTTRFRDNLAEVIDFLNGPRLERFVSCLPEIESITLRELIARDLHISVHGVKSLLVLPPAHVDRIEELRMEVVCA